VRTGEHGRADGAVGSVVSSDGDRPRAHRTLGTGGLESISDNVFAFAATLLVVDIALHPPGTPLEQVLHAWPSYLGYVVSFLTIGAAWLGHTQLTERLAWADPLLLRINLLLLLVVAFLPFPTGLVADALHKSGSERVFVTMYGLTLLAIRLLGFALHAYARHEHLYSPPEEGEEKQDEPRELLPVVATYVIAILIGLAAPRVAVAAYFALAVYLVVPFSMFHGRRSRAPSSRQ
jgi:TMEM175 potassium channel family protein